jgi:serine/threonine protein kinase
MWALGLIYYQMLFGDFPKLPLSEDVDEWVSKPLNERPDLSYESENILKRLLEINPNKRLSSQQLDKTFRKILTFLEIDKYVYD